MTPFGIPTARSIHHVGFTVPDLDQAVDFFTRVLGANLVYRAGAPRFAPRGASSGLPQGAPRLAGVALLRWGALASVELHQFEHEVAWRPPRVSEPGGSHLAFEVADLGEALGFLRDHPDVTLLGEPRTMAEDEPHAGFEFAFFSAPWGLNLELTSMPARGRDEVAKDGDAETSESAPDRGPGAAGG